MAKVDLLRMYHSLLLLTIFCTSLVIFAEKMKLIVLSALLALAVSKTIFNGNLARRILATSGAGLSLAFGHANTALADAIPVIGAKAPDFVLPSNLGKNIGLNDIKGKRTVLYFYPVGFVDCLLLKWSTLFIKLSSKFTRVISRLDALLKLNHSKKIFKSIKT